MEVIGPLIAVLACCLLVRRFMKVRRYKVKSRADAEIVFSGLSLKGTAPQFSFAGNAAEIICDDESVEEMKGVLLAFTLTRIARNKHGEYFWFYFRTDASPLIKHIDQSRAKALLKSKYLAPQPNHHSAPAR